LNFSAQTMIGRHTTWSTTTITVTITTTPQPIARESPALAAVWR